MTIRTLIYEHLKISEVVILHMLHKGVKHILLPQFYLYMLTDSLMIFITIKILKSFDDSESYQLYLLLFNTILTICTTQQLDKWRLNLCFFQVFMYIFYSIKRKHSESWKMLHILTKRTFHSQNIQFFVICQGFV